MDEVAKEDCDDIPISNVEKLDVDDCDANVSLGEGVGADIDLLIFKSPISLFKLLQQHKNDCTSTLVNPPSSNGSIIYIFMYHVN